MAETTSCIVYWLFDDRCVCPWRHGYIGISERWPRRLIRHRYESRFGEFKWKHLFVGTRDQCLDLEFTFRPEPKIGWNEWAGGRAGSTAAKSAKHREKMRQAALARYAKPGEKERTAKAVQKAFEGIDRSGANNGHFGKPTSEAAKQKIRDKIAERGGVAGSNNPNFRHGRYCP